jgi:hypothetical protein
MDLREIGYEDGKWMKVGQNHVQWQDLVLTILNLCVLLQLCWLPGYNCFIMSQAV